MRGLPGAGGASLGALVKDRRVQIGAAIAAGVGLVVLLSRRNASTDKTDPATLDSTGTDSYNAVQADLQNFAAQLRALQDQLDQKPVGSAPNPLDAHADERPHTLPSAHLFGVTNAPGRVQLATAAVQRAASQVAARAGLRAT